MKIYFIFFLFLSLGWTSAAIGQIQAQQVGEGYSKVYKKARKSVRQFKKNHKVKLDASYARVKIKMLDKIDARADKGFTTYEHKLPSSEEKASYIIQMAKEDKDFAGFLFQEFGITGEENSGIKISWPNDPPKEEETPTLPVEPETPEAPGGSN